MVPSEEIETLSPNKLGFIEFSFGFVSLESIIVCEKLKKGIKKNKSNFDFIIFVLVLQISSRFKAKKIRHMSYFSNYEVVKNYSALTAVPVIETNKVLEFASGSTSS